MNAVLSEIERVKQNQQLQEFAKNEKAIADSTPSARGVALSKDELDQLASFIKYCEQKKVRNCPANPAVVASYLSEHARVARQVILATELDKNRIRICESTLRLAHAIEALHDYHGLSNPVATA